MKDYHHYQDLYAIQKCKKNYKNYLASSGKISNGLTEMDGDPAG
jgi:hypothetical protein